MRCLSLFENENGALRPLLVEAPGGGFNAEFNAIFAQQLGFGPPPPGAQPMAPPVHGPQHNKLGGIITAVIVGIVVLTFVGVGIYVWLQFV